MRNEVRTVALPAIDAALAMLPAQMNSPQARAMLVAIGLQESRFTARRQLVGSPPQPVGPAKGFWQFEAGGGCRGVLTHPASRYWAFDLCARRGVAAAARPLWDALENDDVLAAGIARLLLFTDPQRLPTLGEHHAAWDLYVRTWRPGKPHRQTWDEFYDMGCVAATRGMA